MTILSPHQLFIQLLKLAQILWAHYSSKLVDGIKITLIEVI